MAAKQNFTRNMAFRMRTLGITDSDLSRKLGVAPITIGRWKRGKAEPSFEDLDRIAVALGISPAQLFAPATEAIESLDAEAALAVLAATIRRAKFPIK